MKHLLCAFHLFDMNAMKRLSSVINSVDYGRKPFDRGSLLGPSSCGKHRDELGKCQQATTEVLTFPT